MPKPETFPILEFAPMIALLALIALIVAIFATAIAMNSPSVDEFNNLVAQIKDAGIKTVDRVVALENRLTAACANGKETCDWIKEDVKLNRKLNRKLSQAESAELAKRLEYLEPIVIDYAALRAIDLANPLPFSDSIYAGLTSQADTCKPETLSAPAKTPEQLADEWIKRNCRAPRKNYDGFDWYESEEAGRDPAYFPACFAEHMESQDYSYKSYQAAHADLHQALVSMIRDGITLPEISHADDAR